MNEGLRVVRVLQRSSQDLDPKSKKYNPQARAGDVVVDDVVVGVELGFTPTSYRRTLVEWDTNTRGMVREYDVGVLNDCLPQNESERQAGQYQVPWSKNRIQLYNTYVGKEDLILRLTQRQGDLLQMEVGKSYVLRTEEFESRSTRGAKYWALVSVIYVDLSKKELYAGQV